MYTPGLMNQALAQTGSSYQMPPVSSAGYAQAAQQAINKEKADDKASTDRTWGLVNAAANLYTGGAFGKVTGGVNSDGIGNVNKAQGGGGGMLGAAVGILGAGGGGGGGDGGPGKGAIIDNGSNTGFFSQNYSRMNGRPMDNTVWSNPYE